MIKLKVQNGTMTVTLSEYEFLKRCGASMFQFFTANDIHKALKKMKKK